MSDMEKTMRHMEQRKKRYMERIKPHTKEELKKLDVHLRSIWNSMRAALSKGDIELAVSYFCDRTKDGYRHNFKAMSPQMLRRMAKDMGDIQLIKDNGFTIEYDIQITKGGKNFSFYLLFQKDENEKWKIDSF